MLKSLFSLSAVAGVLFSGAAMAEPVQLCSASIDNNRATVVGCPVSEVLESNKYLADQRAEIVQTTPSFTVGEMENNEYGLETKHVVLPIHIPEAKKGDIVFYSDDAPYKGFLISVEEDKVASVAQLDAQKAPLTPWCQKVVGKPLIQSIGLQTVGSYTQSSERQIIGYMKYPMMVMNINGRDVMYPGIISTGSTVLDRSIGMVSEILSNIRPSEVSGLLETNKAFIDLKKGEIESQNAEVFAFATERANALMADEVMDFTDARIALYDLRMRYQQTVYTALLKKLSEGKTIALDGDGPVGKNAKGYTFYVVEDHCKEGWEEPAADSVIHFHASTRWN